MYVIYTYIYVYKHTHRGFPGKASACLYRRCKRGRFSPWVWKIPWRRE